MLKVKSKSIMVASPTHYELQEHAAVLMEKEEEQIREKLERQQEKEARVQALEKEFTEWADRKESKIRQKLQKSTKNKEDHISKIVKKCKDHDKFLSDKYKNFQTRKKADLKNAWKKAEAFNHSIQEHHLSKQISNERHTHKDYHQENLTESRFVGQRPSSNQKYNQRQYLSVNYNNPSKYESKYYNNASKDYWAQLNQSIKQLRLGEKVPQEEEDKHINKIQMSNKLKQTLARFRQHIQDNENEKIQQLGERLEKIQKSRMKKIEKLKKKKHSKEDIMEMDTQDNRARRNKPDRSQRIHSEAIMREKRVHDWSESTKQKREQFLQAHLQTGTEYLEQQKMKYLKTNIAKKIAVSAIQKKLYFERLNH